MHLRINGDACDRPHRHKANSPSYRCRRRDRSPLMLRRGVNVIIQLCRESNHVDDRPPNCRIRAYAAKTLDRFDTPEHIREPGAGAREERVRVGARAHRRRWLSRRTIGRVGGEVTPEQGQQAARSAMLGILASLKAQIRDLDRIAAWLRVYGMVWAAPGFTGFPAVLNGASSLIHDVFGPEIGNHARVAIGVAATPFNAPLEIEAQLELM